MRSSALIALAAAFLALKANAKAVVSPKGPFPSTTESGQYGTNNCGTKDNKSSKCQNLWLNSLEDFCLFAPPKSARIGDSERYEVAWCTKAGRGSRLIPAGTLKGVHFIETPNYIQITGKGDFTKMNIKKGDDGGELDPHGADGNGNPVGALVFATIGGKQVQVMEWHQFIDDQIFSIRACKPGADAAKWCPHIYDEMGCYWNDPGSYSSGFNSCKANNVAMPPGLYKLKNGATSTWHQGVSPTPPAQPAAKSSQCSSVNTIKAANYPKSKRETNIYGQ